MKYQHNIPKPTNTAALIGAVFVGILALGFMQYKKLDPQTLDKWISKLVPEKEDSEKENDNESGLQSDLDDPNSDRSVAQLTEQTQDIAHQIDAIYHLWKDRKIKSVDEPSLMRFREQTVANYRSIISRKLTAQERRKIMRIRLRTEYQLATVSPSKFGAGFQKFASFAASDERYTKTAVLAAVLRFAFDHPLDDFAKLELLDNLDQLAGNYSRDEAIVLVYAFYSNELQDLGERDFAVMVLEHGQKVCRGKATAEFLTQQRKKIDA